MAGAHRFWTSFIRAPDDPLVESGIPSRVRVQLDPFTRSSPNTQALVIAGVKTCLLWGTYSFQRPSSPMPTYPNTSVHDLLRGNGQSNSAVYARSVLMKLTAISVPSAEWSILECAALVGIKLSVQKTAVRHFTRSLMYRIVSDAPPYVC